MTVLIDTSVWVDVLRDASGAAADRVRSIVDDDEVVLTRFNQWSCCRARRRTGVDHPGQLPGGSGLPRGRYRHLARRCPHLLRVAAPGRTVRSAIDCCIAQLAIEHEALLLHQDRDFETIAEIRPLVAQRIFFPAGQVP